MIGWVAPGADILYPGDFGLEEAEVPLYTCLAYDPGGTTGWAVFAVHEIAMYSDEFKILDNIVHWSAGEFRGPEMAQMARCIELAEAWEEAEVVCESFHVRNMAVDLSPVRIAAVLEWALCNPEGELVRQVHYQQPALAMSSVTDDRLRDIGAYDTLRGQPHARDGVRHALTWMRRRKADLSRLGLPSVPAVPAASEQG